MKGIAIVLTASTILTIAPPAESAVVKVGATISSSIRFRPDSIKVAATDTVRWYQIDGDHSSTSGTPGSPDGAYNGNIDVFTPMFDFQFNTPGSYSNFCIPHEIDGMTGKIVVTTPVQGYAMTFINSFSEPDINIQVGETVEFYWSDGDHTLTSGTGSGDPQMGNLINSKLNDTVPAIQLSFNTPGDYPFFCLPHELEGMQTTVHVAGPCTCPCKYDPECDGVTTVLDVTRVINVAFRGIAPVVDPGCPRQRSDVDANVVTNVLDVTKTINVAFRGQSIAANFVDPCL